MGNVSKRQQPDHRADEGHQLVFNAARNSRTEGVLQLTPKQICILVQWYIYMHISLNKVSCKHHYQLHATSIGRCECGLCDVHHKYIYKVYGRFNPQLMNQKLKFLLYNKTQTKPYWLFDRLVSYCCYSFFAWLNLRIIACRKHVENTKLNQAKLVLIFITLIWWKISFCWHSLQYCMVWVIKVITLQNIYQEIFLSKSALHFKFLFF